MGFQLVGNSGNLVEVESATKATRMTIRPNDWGALGSYSVGCSTNIIAAGSSTSTILSFRNTSANLLVIRRVLMSMAVTGTGFAAGVCVFSLLACRAWSTNDTGGTAFTLTTNNMKLRTSMGTTSVGQIMTANTGALSPGTRTTDANPIGQIVVSVPTTVSIIPVPVNTPLLDERLGEYPLVCATNEGFVITSVVPATGTWLCSFQILWDELASY